MKSHLPGPKAGDRGLASPDTNTHVCVHILQAKLQASQEPRQRAMETSQSPTPDTPTLSPSTAPHPHPVPALHRDEEFEDVPAAS